MVRIHTTSSTSYDNSNRSNLNATNIPTPIYTLMKQYPPISSNEQLTLLQGTKTERDSVLLGYSRYIWRVICKRRPGYSMPQREDFFNEMFIGLMDAARTYDPANGSFSNWVVQWTRDVLKRDALKQHTIKVPNNVLVRIHKYYAAEEELTSALGECPSFTDVCDYLQLEDKEVIELIRALNANFDNSPAKFDKEENAFPAPDYEAELVDEVKKAYALADSRLTESERCVLYMKCETESREEAAEFLNMTMKEFTDKERRIRAVLHAA